MATVYRPYPTPPITVAIINQSRQSLFGGLRRNTMSAPRVPIRGSGERMDRRTLAVEAAIDTEDSHILVEEEGAGRRFVVEHVLAMKTLLLRLMLLRTGLHLPEKARDQLPPASGSSTEGMRLFSRSARRQPTDPGGLYRGQNLVIARPSMVQTINIHVT